MFKTNLIIALLISFFTVIGSTIATPILPITTELTQVTLRAGTIVSVELMEELDPNELSVGNAIDLMVRSNVYVNGKVVIATGAIAEGMVKKVKRGCGGDCVEVTITVENVQAVDGQRIYLRSIPHIMKSDCCSGKKNEPQLLPIGTKISSRVLNDVKITA